MFSPRPNSRANSKEHVENISLDPTDKETGNNDIDVGAQILMDHQDIEYTAEGEYPFLHDVCQSNILEHRKLVRKVDWRIVPLAAWACGLQFVDKVGTNPFLRSDGSSRKQLVWSRCCRDIRSPRWPSFSRTGVLLVCLCKTPNPSIFKMQDYWWFYADILFWLLDGVVYLWSWPAIFPCWEVYGCCSVHMGWSLAWMHWGHRICFTDGLALSPWVPIIQSSTMMFSANER